MLELKNVSLSVGARTLLENASATAFPGDKIGIVGPNGCGKTTLLNAIIGNVSIDSGEIVLAKNTDLVYVRQEIFTISFKKTPPRGHSFEQTHTKHLPIRYFIRFTTLNKFFFFVNILYKLFKKKITTKNYQNFSPLTSIFTPKPLSPVSGVRASPVNSFTTTTTSLPLFSSHSLNYFYCLTGQIWSCPTNGNPNPYGWIF